MSELVHQILAPLRMKPPSVFSARVLMPLTSEPLCASVVEKGAAQVAAGQPRQQARLLLLGAAVQDGAERHPLHQQQVRGVVANAAELLDGQAGRQHAAGAAVLLGETAG